MDYKELVEILDEHTQRLTKIYLAYEKKRRDKVDRLAVVTFILVSVYALPFWLKGQSIEPNLNVEHFGIMIFAFFISLIYGYLIRSKSDLNISGSLTEIKIVRQQLTKLIEYVSQLNEYGKFSGLEQYLVDLKLIEAEEIIKVTDKVMDKRYKSLPRTLLSPLLDP